ncbi:MAG: hypothetical protein R6V41_13555 [Desulfobacteraceae bacterium]
MLTEEEKREMLEDAADPARREDFRALRRSAGSGIPSLDEYIRFLDDLQEIFGPFKVSKKIMKTSRNKL